MKDQKKKIKIKKKKEEMQTTWSNIINKTSNDTLYFFPTWLCLDAVALGKTALRFMGTEHSNTIYYKKFLIIDQVFKRQKPISLRQPMCLTFLTDMI